jgi:UDP-glucuronate 4-epimerase
VIESIIKLTKLKNIAKSLILNIGGSKNCRVSHLIRVIEKTLNIKAKMIFKNSTGEMKSTKANTTKLQKLIGYKPKTALENGVKKFIQWYLDFKSKYKIF